MMTSTLADLVAQLEAINAEMRRDRWTRGLFYTLMCLIALGLLASIGLRLVHEFHEQPLDVNNFYYVCPTLDDVSDSTCERTKP